MEPANSIAHEARWISALWEHHMPRRVSGRVAHDVSDAVANADRVTILQPARGLEGLGLGKLEHLALLGQAVDPELVAGMRADDGGAASAGPVRPPTGVVDMGVGEPDLLQRQARLALSNDVSDHRRGRSRRP